MKISLLASLALVFALSPGQFLSAQTDDGASVEATTTVETTATDPLATIDASFSREDLGTLQSALALEGIAFRYDNMDYLNGKLMGLSVSFRYANDTETQSVHGQFHFSGPTCKLWLLNAGDAESSDDAPALLQLASNC
jgi:hypothetical protein